MPEPQPTTVARKDFLSVLDWAPSDLERCLKLAGRLKQARRRLRRAPSTTALAGAHVALLFDKPSLRTRSTFDIAVRELGGHIVELPPEVALGGREPLADVARNLERWVHGAVIRTSTQARVVEFARAAPALHVINALTDQEHPCQALADLLTLGEHWGSWLGRTVAFVGDGNNVATSLAQAALQLGVHVRVATPEGDELPAPVVDAARRVARFGAELTCLRDPIDAVRGADAIYTDVWASMGHEDEAQERRQRFAAYQVSMGLLAHASPSVLFLHCLPAHRGEEVTDEVMESPHSIVFDQAENRLHTAKALLLMLVGEAA